jgi:HAD superfamily hydrolase (TIGR01509 family)
MIKAILFDLDGVLVEAKKIHFDSLNIALKEIDEKYVISEQDHISIFDGLKTTQKLEMLSSKRNLSTNYHSRIWKRKQEITLEKISNLKFDFHLIEMFKKLKNENFLISCCSNSIRKSVFTMLTKVGIIEYFDLILSNEDVKNSKPHPEIYWKAMSLLSILPEETLIVEDSPHGLLAAYRSNANVLRVKNSKDLTFDKLINKIYNISNKMNTKWQDNKLNVLIPMAGAGSRFEKAGYTFPKPLIDVNGKPMIQVVVDSLNIDANYIFIVQKSHREKYNLDTLLNLIAPNCKITEVDGVTEGAACTTLLAKDHINNNNPLLIVNSDQYLDWDSNEFMYKMQEQNLDAGILTFQSTHPKWSYAKTNESGYVTEVAEKNPISNIATVGVYYWKHGKDYVDCAETMISKNIRVNNEFYVCPVFNEAILKDKKIKTFNIQNMWGIGTPEDLNNFLNNYKNKK